MSKEEEVAKQKNNSVLRPDMLASSPDTGFTGSIYGNVPVKEQAHETKDK